MNFFPSFKSLCSTVGIWQSPKCLYHVMRKKSHPKEIQRLKMKSHRFKVWVRTHKHYLQQLKDERKRRIEEQIGQIQSECATKLAQFDPETYVLQYIEKSKKSGYRMNIFTTETKLVDEKNERVTSNIFE